MVAERILARLSALGIKLEREGGALRASPRGALTDEARALIRSHKAELLAALGGAGESKRQRLITRYAERPQGRYVLVADMDPAYPGCMVCGIGIRRGNQPMETYELIVPSASIASGEAALLGVLETVVAWIEEHQSEKVEAAYA